MVAPDGQFHGLVARRGDEHSAHGGAAAERHRDRLARLLAVTRRGGVTDGSRMERGLARCATHGRGHSRDGVSGVVLGVARCHWVRRSAGLFGLSWRGRREFCGRTSDCKPSVSAHRRKDWCSVLPHRGTSAPCSSYFLRRAGLPRLDWHQVCGIMAGVVAATLLAFVLVVPRTTPAPGAGAVAWWYHAAQLIRRRSAYWLSFLYAVTFGGFVGLCSVLPLLLHDVYRVDAMEAGAVAALCGLLGSVIRPVGGYVADRQGGLRTLYYVLPVIAGAVVAVISPSQTMAVVMMVVATAAMGFGNGVVFQLVAEWFPKDIGLASGVVGASGAIGGFLLPILIGTMKGLLGQLRIWALAVRRVHGVCVGHGDRRVAGQQVFAGRTVLMRFSDSRSIPKKTIFKVQSEMLD